MIALYKGKALDKQSRKGKSKYFGFVESQGNAFPEVERQEVDS